MRAKTKTQAAPFRTAAGVFIIECGERTFRADHPSNGLGFWVHEVEADGKFMADGLVFTADCLNEAVHYSQEAVSCGF